MTSQPPENPNSPRQYGYGDRQEQPYPEQAPFYAAPSDALYPPRRRRRRRRGTVWLIVVGVLVALVVAADRIAVVVVQDRLASKIQQSQNLHQKPSVSIAGFPFLTQVVSRDFGHATVDIANFSSGGVPIASIHVDLRGVHVDSSYNRATVDSLVGTATLDYTAVSQVLSNDISNLGHITLGQGSGNQVTATYSVLGTSISADIEVNVLGDNTLEFKTTKVHAPLGINTGGFDSKIQLNALPFGMRLSTAQVTSTGVNISATGTNVLLTGTAVGTVGQ